MPSPATARWRRCWPGTPSASRSCSAATRTGRGRTRWGRPAVTTSAATMTRNACCCSTGPPAPSRPACSASRASRERTKCFLSGWNSEASRERQRPEEAALVLRSLTLPARHFVRGSDFFAAAGRFFLAFLGCPVYNPSPGFTGRGDCGPHAPRPHPSFACPRGKESSMAPNPSPIRIGIYGPEEKTTGGFRGCGLWPPGYAAAVNAAGGTPVRLETPASGELSEDMLDAVDGLVFTGDGALSARQIAEAELVFTWCRERELPLLCVDHGMH